MKKKPAELTFAEAYKQAPPIYAFLIDPFEEAQSCYLRKVRRDRKYLSRFSSLVAFVKGLGTREKPFCTCAADVSPFYDIVGLWFTFRHDAQIKPIFIEVNDWIFQVKPEGVVALDGRLTRLLPES